MRQAVRPNHEDARSRDVEAEDAVLLHQLRHRDPARARALLAMPSSHRTAAMKHSPLPPRRKPLARVQMRQGSTLKASSKTLPKESPRTKATRPERRATREEVFERDGYACQLAVRLQAHPTFPAHECHPPLTVQHVVKASQGGPYTLDNLVAVCWAGNCFWIEQHRSEAAILGLHKDARRLA